MFKVMPVRCAGTILRSLRANSSSSLRCPESARCRYRCVLLINEDPGPKRDGDLKHSNAAPLRVEADPTKCYSRNTPFHPSPLIEDLDQFRRGEALEDTTLSAAVGRHSSSLLISDENLSSLRADPSLFDGCAFVRLSITDSSLSASKFTDSWMRSVRMSGVAVDNAQWLDCQISLSAFAGIDAFESTFRRVSIYESKFDSANFRGSDFGDVAFVDCDLNDVDFSGSKLRNMSFENSSVRNLDLGQCAITNVDFRGARLLSISDGIDNLQGVRITLTQAMELGPSLAKHAGAKIDG